MVINERTQFAISKVIELLGKPDFPKLVYEMYRSTDSKPSAAWSLSNRLLVAIDWLFTYGKYKDSKDREVAGEDLFEAISLCDYRGFNQWKEKGRSVLSGSKAAYILAPMFQKWNAAQHKETKEWLSYDREKKKYYSSDAKGRTYYESDVIDFKEKTYIKGFTGVPVFAKEATFGKEIVYTKLELPELPYKQVAEHFGVKVVPGISGHGEMGSYSPSKKLITIKTNEISTFFHELAHVVDDHLLKEQTGKGLTGGQQLDQETVAQFSAAVMAVSVGYQIEAVAGDTKSYIEGYAKAHNMDHMSAIMKFMHRIENVCDYVLNFGPAETPSRQEEIKQGEPPSVAEQKADSDAKQMTQKKRSVYEIEISKSGERGQPDVWRTTAYSEKQAIARAKIKYKGTDADVFEIVTIDGKGV